VDSVALLSLAVGATLLAWAAVNLAVNLLGTTSFALVLFTLYRQLTGQGDVDASRITRFDRASSGSRFPLTRRRLTRWAVAGLLAAFGIGAFAVHTARLDRSSH